MNQPIVHNNQVWCPRCNQYVQLLKISKAAKIVDVSSKTIYRYIDEGRVYVVRVAGLTTRLCSRCLLNYDDEFIFEK